MTDENVVVNEDEVKPEDQPLFDSLWKFYEEVKTIRITSEYISGLLSQQIKSMQKNIQGLEKILAEKYPNINFNGDYRISNGHIIQELKKENLDEVPK